MIGLISAMSVAGVHNVRSQHSIMGEYSNPELEELMQWIPKETPAEAAFAGPMPLMASILLTTQRPVVNHPHYEDAGLRYELEPLHCACLSRYKIPSARFFPLRITVKPNAAMADLVLSLFHRNANLTLK